MRASRRLLLAAVLLAPVLAAGSDDSGAPERDDEPPEGLLTEDELAVPAPASALRPAQLPDPEGTGCADCHSAVTREWAASAHGLAWVDEVYQEAIAEKRRPGRCWACHVPQPLLAGGELGRVVPRSERRHLGVGCDACHLGPAGAQLGPRGATIPEHPAARSELVAGAESSRLCAACHAKTLGPVIGIADDFEQRGAPSRGLSCVGCHMAPVERRWADGDDVPLRVGRSHALQTPRDPAFLARAFGTRWERGEGRSRVVIRNRAGHRVPGLTLRAFTFRAEALDAEERVVAEAALRVDADAYLPADGTIGLELPPARSARRVRVTALHHEPLAGEPVPFLDRILAPGE